MGQLAMYINHEGDSVLEAYKNLTFPPFFSATQESQLQFGLRKSAKKYDRDLFINIQHLICLNYVFLNQIP
jgi:hypothetical protein